MKNRLVPYLPLAHVAPSLVRAALKQFQMWGVRSLSGQILCGRVDRPLPAKRVAVILLKMDFFSLFVSGVEREKKYQDIFRVCAAFGELITQQDCVQLWFSRTGAICVGKQPCPSVS